MDRDAFDILGIVPRFDLAPGEVQRAYLARASAAHPDRAGRGGGDGGGEAEEGASALNGARADLEDPERRAAVLLKRLGGPAKEQDRSLPDGFLMEMMEVREAMEAAADKTPWIARAEER